MTPWLVNGALSLEGRRFRIGGLRARTVQVAESAKGCMLRLNGEHGLLSRPPLRFPGLGGGWQYPTRTAAGTT